MKKECLGGAVNVRFDGHHFWLDFLDNHIALDPRQFENLCHFAEKVTGPTWGHWDAHEQVMQGQG